MGWIAVLQIGDFCQVLPVVIAANCLQIVAVCFKESGLFGLFKLLHLQQNMRLQALHDDPNATKEELQFPTYPLNLGERKLQFNVKDLVHLPVSLNVYYLSVKDLIIPVFQKSWTELPQQGLDRWTCYPDYSKQTVTIA